MLPVCEERVMSDWYVVWGIPSKEVLNISVGKTLVSGYYILCPLNYNDFLLPYDSELGIIVLNSWQAIQSAEFTNLYTDLSTHLWGIVHVHACVEGRE